MSKKSISSLNFEMDEFGDLGISGFEDGDEFEEEAEFEEEDQETEDDEDDVDSDESESPDLSSFNSRIDKIEATFAALPQMIASSISSALSASGLAEKKDKEEEEEIEDELTGKQIVSILGKRMDKAIKLEFDAIKKEQQPALQQVKLQAEFQTAASKHGQKFVDRMPQVAKVMLKSNGALSVEQAWEIVKDIPTTTKNSKSVKSVKVDADSSDSVGEIKPPRSPFKKLEGKSDSEIFDQAFKSSLLDSVRRPKRR